MAGTLQTWATSMSDLDFAHRQAENPQCLRRYLVQAKLNKTPRGLGTTKRAKEMREELRSHISLFYVDPQHGKKSLK